MLKIRVNWQSILVIFIFVILTMVMLYPLTFNLWSALPDLGDSIHNLWIISWINHKVVDPLNMFDTNIMYPLQNTGTFAEMQFTSSVIAAPILAITNNPVIAYNILLLLSFILTGYGMFLITKNLTNNFFAALTAGIIFAYFPFKFAHLPHLQMISFQWILFAFYFLQKYFSERKKKDLALFTMFFIVQAVTFGYLTIFLYFIIGGYIVYNVLPANKEEKIHIIKNILKAFAIILFSTLPFYIPYFKSASSGLTRTLGELKFYGADIFMYLSAPPTNKVYGDVLTKIMELSPHGSISSFFPGITIYALFTIATFVYFTRLYLNISSKVENIGKKSLKAKDILLYDNKMLFFILITLFGFLMTLGPIVKVAGKETIYNIYIVLYYIFPFIKGIRYLPAFIFIVMFGVSILCGYGVMLFYKRVSNKLVRLLIPIFIIVLIVVEFWSMPIGIRKIEVKDDIPSVYKWLAKNKQGPIVEFPVEKEIDGNAKYFNTQFLYMYYSTYHWADMVNGISGFFPDEHRRIISMLNNFPDETSIELMKYIGIDKIIIHKALLETDDLEKFSNINFPDLKLVGTFDNDIVYKIVNKNESLSDNTSLLKAQIQLPQKVRSNSKIRIPVKYIKNNAMNNYSFFGLLDNKFYLNYYWVNQNNKKIFSKEEIKLDDILIFTPSDLEQIREYEIFTPSKPGKYVLNVELSVGQKDGKKTIINSNKIIEVDTYRDLSNSLNPKVLKGSIEIGGNLPNIVRSGERIDIVYSLVNRGDTIWLAQTPDQNPPGKGSVRVGIDWLDDNRISKASARGYLPFDIFPGDSIQSSVSFNAPDTPGKYTLKIGLVDELVTWFVQANQENRDIEISIEVKEEE